MLCCCSKQTRNNETDLEAEPYKSSIKSCNCIDSKINDYRIEATINGEKLCLDRNQYPVQPDSWTISPWDSLVGTQMYNVDSSLCISIQYQNPRFHVNALPYQIDSSNVQFCETVYITLLNFKPYKACEGCLTNDSYYTALTSASNLSTTILSFKDSVIEGTFEGNFNNGSTAKFKVTNGYFRTRLAKKQY
jgi:hypothetical protein